MIFKFKLDKINSFGYEVEIISLGHFNEVSGEYNYAMARILDRENPCLMIMLSDYLRSWSNEWSNTEDTFYETHHCECCGSYSEDTWIWYFGEKKAELTASCDDHFGGSYGFRPKEVRDEFKKMGVEVNFDVSMDVLDY